MSKKIPLTRSQFAIVDDEDFAYLMQWEWQATSNSRLYYAVKQPTLASPVKRMNRLVAKTPKGMVCDHINHNTLDNRKENLRNVTYSQSSYNKRVQHNNVLGVKNISMRKGRYRVGVYADKKRVIDRTYATLEEAIEVRNDLLTKHHGEFACNKDEAELKLDLKRKEVSVERTIEIYLHNISYWYDGFGGELTDVDEEHIEACISDGISEGELCTTDPENPDVVHYGWWRISK